MIPIPFTPEEIRDCNYCGNPECESDHPEQKVSEDKKTITLNCKNCGKTSILHCYDFGFQTVKRRIYMSLRDFKSLIKT